MSRISPILAAPLALVLLAGCHRQQQPAPAPPQVGYVTLTAQQVPLATQLSGRTDPIEESDVRPQVDGIIKARLFREGSIVHAGQPLYQIDPRPYQALVKQAAGALENARGTAFTAQAQADRYKTLSDSQAVSKQQIDNTIAAAQEANGTVKQDAGALETARINLGYTKILAPIGGQISRSAVTPGALVTASQTTALATIQKLDPIYVDLVQSSDALLAFRRSLAKGSVLPAEATVRLQLSDGTDYPQTGTIEFAEATVDTDTGTVTLRARFPNPNGVLLPGMFVRVTAQQGVVPNGVLAPQQGITRDAKGDATALVVDANGKIEQRKVVAPQAIGNKWLVTSGLKPGDRLVVVGIQNARPGASVKAYAAKLDGAN